MDGTRAKTVSRNSTSTSQSSKSAIADAEIRRYELTIISQNHQVNVETLAVVSDRLESIHLWVRYAARLAQAREIEIEGSASKGLEDLVEDATYEAEREDFVLWAEEYTLLEDGIDELSR